MTMTMATNQPVVKMRKLTDNEKNLWSQLTKDVTPLAKGSVSPIQGIVRLPAAHALRIEFSPCVDLHGVTIHEAYQVVKDHINEGIQNGYRHLTVITGKSGQINLELPKWLNSDSRIRSIAPKNGGGAWNIWLKKNAM
jgi:DNA-nicking Smr family endonuclease